MQKAVFTGRICAFALSARGGAMIYRHFASILRALFVYFLVLDCTPVLAVCISFPAS